MRETGREEPCEDLGEAFQAEDMAHAKALRQNVLVFKGQHGGQGVWAISQDTEWRISLQRWAGAGGHGAL